MRRSNNQTAFYFKDAPSSEYIVNLERINNDRNGNPRYKAIIINNSDLWQYKTASAAVYTFTGHYWGEKKEARYILLEHLKSFLDIEELANYYLDKED